MPRPLQQHGIDALEALYASSVGQPQGLRTLEHELLHRSTPRAQHLLTQVRADLKRPAAGPFKPLDAETGDDSADGADVRRRRTTGGAAGQQLPLVEDGEEAGVGTDAGSHTVEDEAVAGDGGLPAEALTLDERLQRRRDERAAAMTTLAPLPVLKLDQAAQLLRVSLGAPWVEIEQSRQRAVTRLHKELTQAEPGTSNPSPWRNAAVFNAAYDLLARHRRCVLARQTSAGAAAVAPRAEST